MSQPIKTLILRTAGTNCDLELARAFELAGSQTERVHLNQLLADPARLHGFDMLGIPGGFSYGDDIAAGRILANRMRHGLMADLRRFIVDGKPVIGICNGFQVLVKIGLLGRFDPQSDQPPQQVVTLTDNTVPQFVDRWVSLQADPTSPCIWTRGLGRIDMGIAHGEGRFVADDATLSALEADGQVALRYVTNPNGSMHDIAGICDRSGVVLGLMPHPERLIDMTNHPQWTRGVIDEPAGLQLFANAVEHARRRRHAGGAVSTV